RPRCPRRQGDDRHLAPGADRHPRPAGAPRRAADHAAGPRPAAAARYPRHDPRPARPRLASPPPAQPAHAKPSPADSPRPRPRRPGPQKGPEPASPARTPGLSPCSPARPGHFKTIYLTVDNSRRPTRGFGTEKTSGCDRTIDLLLTIGFRSALQP